MKRICLLVTALLLLTQVGCGKEPVPPVADEPDPVPKVYTAEELTGMSAAEIIAIYGEGYTEVVPEGDPPYFYYEDVPYHFIGKPDDEVIQVISSNVVGTEMLATICVGDSLASLEAAATALEGYEYVPVDTWYDEGNGQYGWAVIQGETHQYSCYIKDEVLTSFECRRIAE